MKLLARFGRSSAIYIAASILQKGTAFLLLPLYTRFMPPVDYGIYAIIQSLTQILIIVFTCNLDSAAMRFYYEYREDHSKLQEFWGSVLLTMLLIAAVVGILAILFGAPLFRPFVGDIAFWPYIVLGIITAMFQPFISVLLSVLQAQERAMRYAVVSGSFFLATTSITILLVVILRWGVKGVLVAIAANTVLYGCYALVALRPHYRIVFRKSHVLGALAYSVPQIPHSAAGMVIAAADRFAINAILGTASAGIYNVAFMLGMSVDLLSSNLNRAYIPITMSERTLGGADNLANVRQLGIILVVGTCMLGAGVATFSSEMVAFLAAPAFHDARQFVPILAFAGVASGIYSLTITNVLFFDRRLTRYVPVGTVAGAIVAIAMNITLIPHLGNLGAAVATLSAYFAMSFVAMPFAIRHDPIKWPFAKFALIYGAAFAGSYLLSRMDLGATALNIPVKMICLFIMCGILSMIAWGTPFYFLKAVRTWAADLAHIRG